MRFRAHLNYYIRSNWLTKGMRGVVEKPDLFVDKNEYASDILGIPGSAIKALRYWLQVTGLTQEPKSGKRVQTLTNFGELVYEEKRMS